MSTPKKKGLIGPPKDLSGPYLLQVIRSRSKECGDCWEWAGSFTSGSVPMMYHQGIRRPVRALIMAGLKDSPTPQGHVASTSCENGWCVNPEHARNITKSKMLIRTRKNTNQEARAAKISATQTKRLGKLDDAAIIRIMDGEEKGVHLAKELGVDQSLISAYRLGKAGRFRRANPFAGLGAR